MPETKCYAMVRGSVIRATALSPRGRLSDPVRYVTSKAVAKVEVNEVVEAASNDTMSTPDEETRILLARSAKFIRHVVNINFLRVDPGVLNLLLAAPTVVNASGDTAGFDALTRLPIKSFSVEVWSKLAGRVCADGQQEWGYTLFPHLRGGRISGFQIENGLVSFNVIGAKSMRRAAWGVGPYDLSGPNERLLRPVSGNTSFRTQVLSMDPPAQSDGVTEFWDIIDNGNASNPMPDPTAPLVLDGGGATTSPWIIDGGAA